MVVVVVVLVVLYSTQVSVHQEAPIPSLFAGGAGTINAVSEMHQQELIPRRLD